MSYLVGNLKNSFSLDMAHMQTNDANNYIHPELLILAASLIYKLLYKIYKMKWNTYLTNVIQGQYTQDLFHIHIHMLKAHSKDFEQSGHLPNC